MKIYIVISVLSLITTSSAQQNKSLSPLTFKNILGTWVEDYYECESDTGLSIYEENKKIYISGHEWSATVLSINKLENGFLSLKISGSGFAGDSEYKINKSYILKVIGNKMYFSKNTFQKISNSQYKESSYFVKCN